MPSRTTVTGPTSVDWQIYPDRADWIFEGHDRADMVISDPDRADLIVGDRATLTLPSVFIFTPRDALTLPSVDGDTGLINDPFSITLPEAAGGLPPYTYSVTSLPRGLTFFPSTRVVSGTPSVPGTYDITYTVSDSEMATATRNFSLIFNRPPLAAGTVRRIATLSARINTMESDGPNLYGVGSARPEGTTITVDRLYRINVETGVTTQIGSDNLGLSYYPAIGALAYSNNTMYAFALADISGRNRHIHTINLTTGVSTRRVAIGDYIFSGMAFHGGFLYAIGYASAGFVHSLYRINISNGSISRVGRVDRYGISGGSAKDLTSDGTNLIMLDDTTDAAYTINAFTGVGTRIGSTSQFGARVAIPSGLAWHSDQTYMTSILSLIHI